MEQWQGALEIMVMGKENQVPSLADPSFWKNRRVFITGHTGFKGSWACLWLQAMGADVTGYALAPPTNPSLFAMARVREGIHSIEGDVRDFASLAKAMQDARPEVVIHMAAQALVRDSYKMPLETYATNVMGTAHLLEAVRLCPSVRGVVVVTTDKCYENREWAWGYREGEALGGYDPYSSSKACAELVTAAYRNSFFNSVEHPEFKVGIATARAGNVIGGGDWANDRLVPDCLRSLLAEVPISIRFPQAIRPWQHVLEPLNGYFILAERLVTEGSAFATAWNFGPSEDDAKPVEWIVNTLCQAWPGAKGYEIMAGEQPHEAHYLKLDCARAKSALGWHPRWSLATAIKMIVDWTVAYKAGDDLRQLCLDQIGLFSEG